MEDQAIRTFSSREGQSILMLSLSSGEGHLAPAKGSTVPGGQGCIFLPGSLLSLTFNRKLVITLHEVELPTKRGKS